MKFEEIKELDDAYVMHTYGRYPVALEKGAGATLFDTDGKSYIDLNAGIGVNCLGHANPALVAAITEQAGKLLQASNLYYTEPMVKAAQKLVNASGMKKVFFANSGAEANEGMLKLARKYAFQKSGGTRYKVLTLKGSFHGRTLAALKATGQERFHKYFGPFPDGFSYIEPNDIEDLKAHADENVCAVVMEMVQGESGVCPLDKTYVKEAEAYCKAHDILFLVDEVQTGVGRCGSFFAYEQYGVAPDLVSTAKGLGGGVPMGAVLSAEKCADVFEPGDHGTTFGGNALAAAAAGVVVDTVGNDAFLSEVREKGAYFMEGIRKIGSAHVKEVRGLGLMIGIEMDMTELKPYIEALTEKGVLAITAGKNVIRLLPPLVISYEEINTALAAMKEVFTA
ncbi:MAG: aspartate aminotransferase family protein [Eubacteriales bacterium]|nr:aspartate aminotransferase family protein [Eubacteriales bacterium]